MQRKGTLTLIVILCCIIGIAYLYHYIKYPNEEIKLGAVFDLTGSLSYMGQWSLEGAKLAEQMINQNGGIKGKRLQLVIDDAATTPKDAANIFQKMVSVEKIPAVIGFNGSSEVMAAAPIAESHHVILFSTGGASPRITRAGEYVFRNRLSGAVEASKMAEVAFNDLKFKKGIILYINTDYGQGYYEAFNERFTGLGGTILMIEPFDQDMNDFKAHIEKIQGTLPVDFVYLASHVREAGMLFKQSKELGLRVQWLASNAIEAPELFTIAGDAAYGVIYTVEAYDPNSEYASTFNKMYKAKYGRDSEMFAAHAYDAVRILTQLIGEYGYDGDLIRRGLYAMRDYPGVSGITSFDKNGDVIKSISLKIVEKDQFAIIEPGYFARLFGDKE